MSDDRYRYSFDSVAEQYERARPLYADAAVDWALAELGVEPGARILDLAAGTGKLTRQLVARGFDVVAVEPGDEMRGVLERVVPGVEALAGAAEAIPLPDGSVDAVTVGQAFHWFEPPAALVEMHRVLRGGGYGLFWNIWDEEDPLLHAVGQLLARHRPERAHLPDGRELRDETRFAPPERRSFTQARALSADQLVGWAGSTSGVVNASREDQAAIEAEIRRLAAGHDGDVSIRTEVVVARRLS